MKIRLLFFFLFGCAFPLLGQQPAAAPAPSVPPLPTGPLLKRTPDYSEWSVTFKGVPVASEAPSAKGATGGGQGKEKDAVVTQSTVVKTGSTIVEQNIDAQGQQRQIWHVSGLRITILPDVPNPRVYPDFGGDDIHSVNFAASDFAGLDWISAATYSGTAQYQGRDCIVFNGTVSPLDARVKREETIGINQARALGQHAADAIMVPAVAYIDLDTRLPLYAQFGEEKRFYQYAPNPPKTPIQLPVQLAGPVKQYEQKIDRLSAPAARPF